MAFAVRTPVEREGVRKPKKPKGVKIWTKVKGKLLGERWVPCTLFAKEIRRPYRTVLKWMRRRWIPALQLGHGQNVTCITPRNRAHRAYRELQKSGKLRAPRR